MQRLRASDTDRTFICPGWYLSADCPDPDVNDSESSAIADEGTMMHEAIAIAIRDPEQTAITQGFEGRSAMIVDQFSRRVREIAFEHYENISYAIEQLFKPARYPWQGHDDFAYVGKDRETKQIVAGVIDYKTGRLAQPEAWKHLQLRNYGVMWAKLLKERGIEIDAMELWLFSAGNPPETRFTKATMNQDLLKDAEKDLRKVANIAKREGAKRIPGVKQCKYCPCAGNPSLCPESCMAIMKLEIPQTTEIVSAADVSNVMKKWKQCQDLGRKLESWAKAKLEDDPDCIPGWTLTPGKTTKELTDMQKAFLEIHEHLADDIGEASEVFASCTSVSISKLIDAVYAYKKADDSSWSKKAIEKLVQGVLSHVLDFRTQRPSLKQTKE